MMQSEKNPFSSNFFVFAFSAELLLGCHLAEGLGACPSPAPFPGAFRLKCVDNVLLKEAYPHSGH